jgi:hypothetical protein
MKKTIILLCLFIAAPSIAAVVSFDKVTTYTDSTPIPAAKLPNILYRVYTAPGSTGPWTAGPESAGNVIVAPDPVAGSTAWYSVTATLDGVESAKCVPASKTVAIPTPSAPPGCSVR